MNMNQFVLAFPLSVAVDEPFAITENVQVLADTKTLMIPGCSVQFNVVRQDASADLLSIFREHCDLTEDEEKALFAHRSLLFLLGNVKSMEDSKEKEGFETEMTSLLKTGNDLASGIEEIVLGRLK